MSRFIVNHSNVALFEARCFANLDIRLAAFGTELKTYIQWLVSTPVFPRSTAGNPPHLETGDLQASIFSAMTGHRLDVGTTLLYGYYLETGTSKVKARPFLVNSLYAMIHVLEATIN